MSLISTRNVTVRLQNRIVVSDVSLNVDKGEFVGLIGPNGAGKSTFLKAIAALLPTYGGEITLNDVAIQRFDRRTRARKVAYLDQETSPHWPVNVKRLVELGRLPYLRYWDKFTASDRDSVEKALKDTDTSHLSDRIVTSLSAGEQKRVMIARALASDPALLLADEPIATLDPSQQIQITKLLHQRARDGKAILAVLHDLTLATRFCDRIVVFLRGRIFEQGPPQEIMTQDTLRQVFQLEVQETTIDDKRIILPWDNSKLHQTNQRCQ